MIAETRVATRQNMAVIKALTFVMFMMFAMTTDSVGLIIPEIIATFHLSLTAAGSFQYATMSGIALAGFLLGHLADRFGRKRTIIAGLTLFAAASYLFVTGNSFWYFCALMASLRRRDWNLQDRGARAHRGHRDVDERAHLHHEHGGRLFWRRLDYRPGNSGPPPEPRTRLAMALRDCRGHLRFADRYRGAVRYPVAASAKTDIRAHGKRDGRNRQPLCAWLLSAERSSTWPSSPQSMCGCPRCLQAIAGRAAWLGAWSISIFFLLRAAGRFLGAWMLNRLPWTGVLAIFSALILACFAASAMAGVAWAIFLLPLSGLFMSVIYPTINSRGISCLPKSEHGAGAGVLLFFTCLSAVLAPLAMGAVSDAWAARNMVSSSPQDLQRCYSRDSCSTGCSIRRFGSSHDWTRRSTTKWARKLCGLAFEQSADPSLRAPLRNGCSCRLDARRHKDAMVLAGSTAPGRGLGLGFEAACSLGSRRSDQPARGAAGPTWRDRLRRHVAAGMGGLR